MVRLCERERVEERVPVIPFGWNEMCDWCDEFRNCPKRLSATGQIETKTTAGVVGQKQSQGKKN